jgi:hypothetical protein
MSVPRSILLAPRRSIPQSLGEVTAWRMPLVLYGYQRATFEDGPVDDLPIALSPDGHVNGGAAVLFIPADSVSSDAGLHLAPDLHVDGDAFDCTLDYEITVECVGGQFVASARSLPALDTTAPTLVSATVTYSDPNALVLVFSEAVYLADVAGLSLAFSVGTARTVTAIESGNGTDTVTVTLSGNVAASDVFTMDVAASSIQDLNGNWLAALDDFACANNVGEPVFADTILFLRGDNLGADTSAITTWTDQSGEGNSVTQSDSAKRPTVLVDATINSQKAANFDGTDDALYNNTGLLDGGSAAPDYTAVTVLLVWKHDGTGDDIPFSFSDTTSNEYTHADLVRETGVLKFFCGNNSQGAGAAFSSTTWHYAWGIHRGASRDLYIDGALFGTNAVAVNPGAVKYCKLGAGVQTGAYPLDGKIAELRFIGRELASEELAAWEAYVGVRYGL